MHFVTNCNLYLKEYQYPIIKIINEVMLYLD
jgi:hypothetical protein